MERIAQEPAAQRDASRLMVVDRKTGAITHTTFAQIGEHLPANARFFRNNAAVLKARLFGKRSTSGKVECLLLTALQGHGHLVVPPTIRQIKRCKTAGLALRALINFGFWLFVLISTAEPSPPPMRRRKANSYQKKESPP
jgi:S-adenosylmethionine:tRNA-ribosyltransferase-isomerase (queuine synthetase)